MSCPRFSDRCGLAAAFVAGVLSEPLQLRRLSGCCCYAPPVVHIARNAFFFSQSLGWWVGNKNCDARECVLTRVRNSSSGSQCAGSIKGDMRLSGLSSSYYVSFWLCVSRMGARAPLWQPPVLCVFPSGVVGDGHMCYVCVCVVGVDR